MTLFLDVIGRFQLNHAFDFKILDNVKPNRPAITANHSNSYEGERDLINVMLNDNLTLMCNVRITSGQAVLLEWTEVQVCDSFEIYDDEVFPC